MTGGGGGQINLMNMLKLHVLNREKALYGGGKGFEMPKKRIYVILLELSIDFGINLRGP